MGAPPGHDADPTIIPSTPTPSRRALPRSTQRRKASPLTRWVSVALIVIGLIVTVIALMADVIGLGAGDGIGWKQIIAAIVGIVMVIIGLNTFIQPFGPSSGPSLPQDG